MNNPTRSHSVKTNLTRSNSTRSNTTRNPCSGQLNQEPLSEEQIFSPGSSPWPSSEHNGQRHFHQCHKAFLPVDLCSSPEKKAFSPVPLKVQTTEEGPAQQPQTQHTSQAGKSFSPGNILLPHHLAAGSKHVWTDLQSHSVALYSKSFFLDKFLLRVVHHQSRREGSTHGTYFPHLTEKLHIKKLTFSSAAEQHCIITNSFPEEVFLLFFLSSQVHVPLTSLPATPYKKPHSRDKEFFSNTTIWEARKLSQSTIWGYSWVCENLKNTSFLFSKCQVQRFTFLLCRHDLPNTQTVPSATLPNTSKYGMKIRKKWKIPQFSKQANKNCIH